MAAIRSIPGILLLFSVACASPGTQAFPRAAPSRPVVEFYNQGTHHYFITVDPAEIADIEAGKAGPSWVRTGNTLNEYVPLGEETCSPCVPVSRFYAPGPNSHFFTLDPVEAESLKRPGTGWIFEGIGFQAIPAPAHAAACSSPYTSVYRLYNNRFAFNDSNHRFVTDDSERVRMVAEGWIDEGVKMCTYGPVNNGPLRSFAFDAPLGAGKIRPSADCEDESKNLGACMALNNLAPPTASMGTIGDSPAYGAKTGLTGQTFIASVPPAVAPTTVFVQQGYPNAYGIHLDTIQRGPAVYTSVNPLYQFRTSVYASGADARVFPFRQGAFYKDAEISVKFLAFVKTVNLRNSVSAAYGHPTIEFIDQRSGKHVYFTVLTYGTVAAADYLAPDVATGKVIVGTTFRGSSPYIRNLASWTFPTPSGFVAENVWGRGGPFEFRMNRDEFTRVLQSARSVDSTLSGNPDDYLLDNFHFNNEVYGDGEIGMNIAGFRMEIVPRGS